MQIPLFIPDGEEQIVSELPRLDESINEIAVDTETYDPNLKKYGPGFFRKDGFLCGVSLAWRTDKTHSIYLPIRHLCDNIDTGIVLEYLRDLFRCKRRYIFANASYDLGWLRTESVRFASTATFRDIQIAESLIDEEADSYSLDALAKRYLDQEKKEANLIAYAEANNWKNAKRYMDKLPAKAVAPYARADVEWTLEIHKAQGPILEAENLHNNGYNVLEIEDKIIPICHEMSWQGVQVDLDAADQLLNNKDYGLKPKFRKLHREMGEIDIWSNDELAILFDENKLPYPRTEKGNPSFTKDSLRGLEHPISQNIFRLRELHRLYKVYVEDTIIGKSINERLYTQFLQTHREEGGTRSGRFSSKFPNLQQVPKRSEIGKLIRKIFVKDPGSFAWCKCDYSSQEPRFAVHYALLSGMEEALVAKQYFEEGKKLYNFFEDITKLDYNKCKELYLARTYGMRDKSLSKKLGCTVEEATVIGEQFDEKAPWISELFDNLECAAIRKGYIKTIAGRKSHFDTWVPLNDWKAKPIKGRKQAIAANNGRAVKQFKTYRALNRLLQGSGADQTKLAIVHMSEVGLVPQLTVHDEINRSVNNEKEALLQKEIMENAIPLLLPVVVDMDLGDTWQ